MTPREAQRALWRQHALTILTHGGDYTQSQRETAWKFLIQNGAR